MAARASGLSYTETIETIVDLAMSRYLNEKTWQERRRCTSSPRKATAAARAALKTGQLSQRLTACVTQKRVLPPESGCNAT